jgi:hypothetical protein
MEGCVMSAAAVRDDDVNDGARSPFIYGVLAGDLALRYGTLPIVPLPQEDEMLLGFVQSMGDFLASKGLYRRDDVIVIVDMERRRLLVLSAEAFCSWSQHYVATSKTKYDSNGDAYDVIKDMPTEVAKKVLVSFDFLRKLPMIEDLNPIPLPEDGEQVRLLEEGFDGGVLSFGLD